MMKSNRSRVMLMMIFVMALSRVAGILTPTSPSKTSVIPGLTVRFGCSTDRHIELRWVYITSVVSVPTTLANGNRTVPGLSARYSVFSGNGASQLTIDNTEPADSRTYLCQEISPEGASGGLAFELTVQDVGSKTVIADVGSRPVLSCDANSSTSVQWTYESVPRASVGPTTIYSRGQLVDSVSHRIHADYSSSFRKHRLTFIDVHVNDAGLYECTEQSSTSEAKHYVWLAVLERPPDCRLNSTDSISAFPELDHIAVTCHAAKVVGLDTVFSCSTDTGLRFQDENVTIDSSGVTYRTMIVADRVLGGKPIHCSVKYSSDGSDAPVYKHDWVSSNITVINRPTISTSKPPDQLFQHGDVLTCSSEVSPKPALHWAYDNNLESGAELRIDVCKLDGDKERHAEEVREVVFTCVAKRGVIATSSSVSIKVLMPLNGTTCSQGDWSHVLQIGSVVGTFVLLILLVGIAIWFKMRGSPSQPKTTGFPTVENAAQNGYSLQGNAARGRAFEPINFSAMGQPGTGSGMYDLLQEVTDDYEKYDKTDSYLDVNT